MRFFLILIPLLLAACSPPAAPSADSTTPQETPRSGNADAHALQQTVTPGQWSAAVDEGTFAARFTAPDSSERFSIICNAANGAITLTFAGADASSLKLITTTHTLDLPVRARANTLTARLAESEPEHRALITVLGSPDDHFAVQVGDATTVFPWDDALRTTLVACKPEEPPSPLPEPTPR